MIYWRLHWIQRALDLNHKKSKIRMVEVDGRMCEVLFLGSNSAAMNRVAAIMESEHGVDVLYWDDEGTPSLLRDVPVLKIWDAIEVIERGGKSKYYVEGRKAEVCGLWHDQGKVFEAMMY